MSTTFLIADTHFSHANTFLKFKREDGTPLRNFTTVEEMNEHMISAWNSVVGPHDRVYHLGDFCFGKKNLEIAARLNGTKYLVMGNHDMQHAVEYLKYFKRLFGVTDLNGYLLTHVPVSKGQIKPRFKGNIHGHLHDQFMKDPDYLCVSVEQLNYFPITLENAIARIELAQQIIANATSKTSVVNRILRFGGWSS